MNGDIRISVNFVQHPKTKKTIRKYGHAAIVSIIALWGFAAQRRPEGNLTGMDIDDIAIAACWDGDEQEFFGMCVEMKWIDVHENGEIHLHGWKEAQGYVINAPARAERSRRAAQARWEKREKKELEQISGDNANSNAQRMLNACSTHAQRMPEAMRNPENGNAPSPSPSPSPSHYGEEYITPLTPQGGDSVGRRSTRFTPPSPDEVQRYCDERHNGIVGSEFCDFYASKGWMIGKAKMKDWKAAIRTWERKRQEIREAAQDKFAGAI